MICAQARLIRNTHLRRVHYNCACPDERVVEFLSLKKASKQVFQFQKKSVSPSNSLKKFLKSDVDIFKERVYKFIVYNKTDVDVPHTIKLDNIGRETNTYFYHIIKNTYSNNLKNIIIYKHKYKNQK